MQLFLDIQNTLNDNEIPAESLMQQWIELALAQAGFKQEVVEMTIRIVDANESQHLNLAYREMDKPTNILSFPFDAPPPVVCDLLGDLVICQEIVESEAKLQGKPTIQHWCHLLIHGTLHLLGFDHIEDDDAEEMESLEISILEKLGISNPYLAEQ